MEFRCVEKLRDYVNIHLNHLSTELHDLWMAQHNLKKQVECLKTSPDIIVIHVHDISDLQQRMKALELQVQCGISGHKFQLTSRLNDTEGSFICEWCNAELIRDLTPEEIKAANKLGLTT